MTQTESNLVCLILLYSRICLEGLRKIMKKFSQVSCLPGVRFEPRTPQIRMTPTQLTMLFSYIVRITIRN
jgi:hypothetical protein